MTSAFLPLERLLAEGRPPAWPVAATGERRIDWATFLADICALHAALESPAGRWALFTTDAYAFAVGLMAIWQRGSVAVVVPNRQPGTLAAIATTVRGLVTDGPAADGMQTQPVLGLREGRPWTPAVLDPAAVRLELSTSGTTGDRRSVAKTLAQLGDEVRGLERRWGGTLDGREVLATVSQQHIYGLLFRVLWPLCAGRVFHAATWSYPDQMRAALASGARGCLVSTPAHLRRLKDMQGARGLASVCEPIFSSGAPLDASTAARLAEWVGCAPFEIFGSTETGGVAWRQQSADAPSRDWRPFEDVAVEIDATGLLRVASPYAGADGPVLLADRATRRPGGRFVLGGRSDRDVKIGGKRLSLPDMEERLLRHGDVSEVALTVVPARGEPRVAAAVVLTPAGRGRLRAAGRRPLTAELTASLTPYWDRVLLPRLWRFVERLPEDEQGKLASLALAELFAGDLEESPQTETDSATPTTCRRRWRVPEALAWCEGHFPELPVVPGFVQLGWVIEAARGLVGPDVTVIGVDGLKFREPLRPGDVVDLQADWSPGTACLSYRLVREDGRIVASGRCRLGESRA